MASVCRGCKQPVVWALTEQKGRRIPLDPEPNPAGNVAVFEPSPGRLIARVMRQGEAPVAGEVRYMPHHATCPQAAMFR